MDIDEARQLGLDTVEEEMEGLYDSMVEMGGRNIDDNPNARFENAIALNVFNDDNIVFYMYMYSDSKFDWFKHILTRDYISVQREIK